MRYYTYCLVLIGFFLSSCATTTEELDETKSWTAEKFFYEAKGAMKSGDFESAIKYFEKLESRFPFGRYAQQAQLETAYAYYKYDETEAAIAAAERFIKLHPRHPRVDYAYYIKGLASYIAENNLLEETFGKDPSQLDPSSARKSFGYFADLIKRFPDSKYVSDSRRRMDILRNTLAKHEINVARYYLKHDAHVAAANRAKYVIEHFQNTPSMPEALVILRQTYKKLQINELEQDTQRIIKLNSKSK